MTDERLDQILKQALAPEIADTEIAVKQAGRNYYMKKIWKIGVAAVACAALLVAGTIAAGHQTVQKEPGAVSISKNPFVICAQAAELTKDKPVYIKESVSNTFGYAAWDDGKTGKMGFVMEMPLSVKGDDIKTISYHIKNGFFQVTDTGETDDMIVDSEAYEGDTAEAGITERGETEATLDIYQKHADDYMVKEVPSGAKEQALSSYTVAYDRQSSENTTINICGTQELSQDEITAMHSSTTDPGELAKLYDKVFKDTVITCTVTFTDGTSQKRQIGIGGAVMTYEELGIQTDDGLLPGIHHGRALFLRLEPSEQGRTPCRHVPDGPGHEPLGVVDSDCQRLDAIPRGQRIQFRDNAYGNGQLLGSGYESLGAGQVHAHD